METRVAEAKEILVPKLRFKEFDETWHNQKIGSGLSIDSGRDYKHLDKGEIPV